MGFLRVLALIGGAILLLPGLCFLVVGGSTRGSDALVAGAVGLVLLLVAIGLFWLGFRLERPKGDDAGPKSED